MSVFVCVCVCVCVCRKENMGWGEEKVLSTVRGVCAGEHVARPEAHKSRNKGRTSTDRSTKATLMHTVPRSNKVVYGGFHPATILRLRWYVSC